MKTQILLMLAILSIIFLSGCKSYPKLTDQQQKSPVFVYVTINGKEYISVEYSTCYSRLYHIGKDFIGPLEHVSNRSIKECDRIVGRSAIDYTTYTSWLEDMRIWIISKVN